MRGRPGLGQLLRAGFAQAVGAAAGDLRRSRGVGNHCPESLVGPRPPAMRGEECHVPAEAGDRRVHRVAVLDHPLSIGRQWAGPWHKGLVARFLLPERQHPVAADHARADPDRVRDPRAGPEQQLKAGARHGADRPARAEPLNLGG
ncbi:hypothetical protein PUH89_03290 [Rhodobacter capsulatus]|nr:hypothetical protein [Rhodobacter capsulatus]WER10027.1 hypothetical protein PUH89_03290 [Rhodobacter capsulatus]